MEPIETYEHAGLTIELHYDEDGERTNPRDMDNPTIFRFFREASIVDMDDDLPGHSDYGVGRFEFTCPVCDGAGELDDRWRVRISTETAIPIDAPQHAVFTTQEEAEAYADTVEVDDEDRVIVDNGCPRCNMEGVITPDSAEEYVRHGLGEDVLAARFARYSDYGSGGSRLDLYDADEEPDERVNGVVYVTRESADLTGLPPEEDGGAMRAIEQDVDSFQTWLDGEVYGYVIKGPEGEELEDLPDLPPAHTPGTPSHFINWVGSCWGFLGDREYCLVEARSEAESIAEQIEAERQERAYWLAREVTTV